MTQSGPRTDQLRWDDLRFVLGLAQEGSIRQTAARLGVSHSTVLRRLQAIEKAMGTELFVDRGEGYQPTLAGQDVIETAEELERTIRTLERRVAGQDAAPEGEVCVTFPDPMATLIMPVFADLAGRFPGIEITAAAGVAEVDLSHRAADVAVRVTHQPPPDLIGRRIGVAGVGVYGSRRYLAARSSRALSDLDWITVDKGSPMSSAGWLATHVPDARVALRVSASWSFQAAIDADIGVALFPCMLGDIRPEWERVALATEMATPLWVLTHRDLRRTARIRLVRDAIVDELRERQSVIEGTP